MTPQRRGRLRRGRAGERRQKQSRRSRDRDQDAWQNSIDFVLALDSAHSYLRDVAQDRTDATNLHQAAGRALVQARLYQARERLLMSAPPDLVTSGRRRSGG